MQFQTWAATDLRHGIQPPRGRLPLRAAAGELHGELFTRQQRRRPCLGERRRHRLLLRHCRRRRRLLLQQRDAAPQHVLRRNVVMP